MITSTDKKIIHLLQNDGRASFSDIAQHLGITPPTAAKRVKDMLTKGTITIRGILNPYKLGLIAGACIKVLTRREKQKEFYRMLNAELFTSTVISTLGEYDSFCIVRTRTRDELHNFISANIAVHPAVINYEVDYIDNTFKHFQVFGKEKSFEPTPDLKEIDWELIRQLCLDGRQSNSEVADKLGLHVSTVSRRIQYLLGKDYVRILPQPDPNCFDYASSVIVQAWINTAKVIPVCEMISGFEEVYIVSSLINRPAIIFGVHSSSNDKTTDLINRFLSIDGLRTPSIILRSRVIKSNYWWHSGSLD